MKKEKVGNNLSFPSPHRTERMTLCNNNAGFTLIELLIVVLISGILVAVAVPHYQKAILKSHMSNLQTMVRSMNPSLMLYHLEHNVWPASFEDLDIVPDGRLLSKDILAVNRNVVCNLWGNKVACFYPGYQPYKVYMTIDNKTAQAPVWKCCWGGENNLIKSLCQQFFPSGEYVEKATQYGFIGEQCIVTPY